ncbi:PA14 domain-containing protein, partial [Akkermansia sp.]
MKKKDAPKIVWHKTEETGVHDWEGYIRIPFDKEYAFTIQMDDNGYLEIDNQKVVELKDGNSSKKAEGKKELKQGYHYVKLHHENLKVPDAIAPYPNAEEFVPQMDGA